MLISCGETPKIDLIVHNARIYTVNENFDIVEAMAIDNGKIIAVGAENEIKNKYLANEYLDAQQMTIYPGFIDAHCHYFGYASLLQELDLTGTKSFDEILQKTKNYTKTNKQEWIIGRGWDQNDWKETNFPTKERLDKEFPTTPILLMRIDGHAALVNQKALDMAKINLKTIITGGVVEIKNGMLTGILIDNAIDEIKKYIPKKSKKDAINELLIAQQKLIEVGLTTIDEAGIDQEQIELIEQLHESNQLKLKIYAMISSTEELLNYYLKKGPYKTNRLSVCSFKFYADGALGSRGACLLQPYSDDNSNHGLILTDKSFLKKYASLLYQKGFQMNTHCIGDSANQLILSIYKEVLKTTNDKRWRIEHAQVIDSSQFEVFANYNIIPSVQPTHATSDMYWAINRLGNERIKMAYAYKKLMQQNGLIALGTDFPVEQINPMLTFYAATERKDTLGNPPNGFQKENALTRQEALKGMTIWAAMANFEEKEKGSLEVGKSADFVLLNQAILEVEPSAILHTKVLKTFINGENVYSNIQ